MAIKKEEIEHIKIRIANLEKRIEEIDKRPVCPLCGSKLSKSTVFNRNYCTQEFGYCGVWVLHGTPNKRSENGSTYFRRSSFVDGIMIADFLPIQSPLRVYYFIGSDEVSRDEYLLRGGWRDLVEII